MNWESPSFRESSQNQTQTNATWHPELALAQWAAVNLSETERAQTTMYTSGEHCPMCAAAHSWAGLGRVVDICSGKQFASWCQEWGVPRSPVAALAINEVAPYVIVEGPVPELMEQVRKLHQQYFKQQGLIN